MLVQRRIPWRMILSLGLRASGVGAAWAAVAFCLYTYAGFTFLKLPFLPVATIGTAVAFYVGFKNNSAYERFWEGRKIWGGIVNVSRSWAAFVLAYVDQQAVTEHGAPGTGAQQLRGTDRDGSGAYTAHRELVYRHLAWINALRVQLRQRSRFMAPDAHPKVKQRLAAHAEHMRNDWDKEIAPFLSQDEHARVSAMVNPATHLLNRQAQQLASLRQTQRLDLFHQIELMNLVKECYDLPGRCERIKNTPFPRQYAEFSRWFVRAFLFLVPFGLLDVFGLDGEIPSGVVEQLQLVVPMLFSAGLIAWVFFTMEGVGDASEDPFERSMNDVPMNALCRGIERDLRQMLGETEIPEAEQPIGLILY